MAQGLRQQDMEDRGLNYKYYQRIEAGKVNLTLKSMEKLAAALGIEISDLLRAPRPKGRSNKRGRQKTQRR